jgi:hypothetical protein
MQRALRRRRHAQLPKLLLLCLSAGLASSCEPPQSADAGSQADVDDAGPATVSCESAVGGPADWLLETSEGTPGFDEELAGLDLQALPATLDLSVEGEQRRAVIGYALGMTVEELGESLDRDALLARGPMGEAVAGAFAAESPAGDMGVDFIFLRRGLHRFYACDRGLPATLDDFRAFVFDYSDIAPNIIDSRVKDDPRHLYEAPEVGIFVAETVSDGVVRETEILRAGARDDGSLDFLVYDGDGKLADRSEFATTPGNGVVSASPYTCMTCHIDRDTWRHDIIVPDVP